MSAPTKEYERTIYLQLQTPHYSFQMTLTEIMGKYHTFHFIVGNIKKPCLEGSIKLESTIQNDRYKQYENIATLIKLDALEECALEDINTEYLQKYSFGKEMLDAIVFFINCHFPQIKTVGLNDSSYIPCDRTIGDILDLLTYSIALYKKTWYEERLDAYNLPKENHKRYRKQVEEYASKESKKQMTFEDLYDFIMKHNAPYASNIITNNYDTYKTIYEKSETFPDFFQTINKMIPREEKCKFFKNWLELFIHSKIQIDRAWYFDLYPKITVIEQPTLKPNRNTTRRRNRK